MTLKELCENKFNLVFLEYIKRYNKGLKDSSKTEELYKSIAKGLLNPKTEEEYVLNMYRFFTRTFFDIIHKDDPEYEKFDSILRETFGKRLPEGEIIGYKKAVGHFGLYHQSCIVKLRIPEDALRSKAFGKKSRCSKAYVEDIYAVQDHNWKTTKAYSCYDPSFNYILKRMVEVKDFDICPWKECSTGIHFFENEQDAIDYQPY